MLTVRNLNKSFNGRQILNNVDLTVNDGEVLCIVGPSGAGKTTLLRCITGLEEADSGEFKFNDQEFNPQTDSERIFGVVFQDFNLFPNLSVNENITLAPRLVKKMSVEKADQQASSLESELGLDKVKDQYPWQLSGGQKQRVAIARALAMKPQILCYDEPTSALDPNLRDEVAKLILKLKQGGTTQLIITHDMDFAQKVADQLLQVQEIGSSQK